jgi:hypothetical protein
MAHPDSKTLHARHGRALGAALFIPPIALLGNIEIAYALVPAACASRNTLALHLVNVSSLALAIVGAATAWRSWRAEGISLPEEDGSPLARIRFIAGVAVLLGGVCALVIVAQWTAVFLLDPCQ